MIKLENLNRIAMTSSVACGPHRGERIIPLLPCGRKKEAEPDGIADNVSKLDRVRLSPRETEISRGYR